MNQQPTAWPPSPQQGARPAWWRRRSAHFAMTAVMGMAVGTSMAEDTPDVGPQVAELETELAAAISEGDELREQLDKAAEDSADLDAVGSATSEEIDGLRSQLDDAESRITALEDELSTAQRDLSTAESEADGARAELAAIQAAVAEEAEEVAARAAPAPPPHPAPAPPPPPAPAAATGVCDPSYPTVCIPPAPPDLNCGDISARQFTVVGSDPHGFDGNNDGVGCES